MSKTTPDPYVAVALQPSFKGAHTRQDIMTNIESIAITMRASMWLSAELPVRMMTLPEGVLQGFQNASLEYVQASIEMVPETCIELDVQKAKGFLQLIDKLEDDDDIQDVYHNADIPDEALED